MSIKSGMKKDSPSRVTKNQTFEKVSLIKPWRHQKETPIENRFWHYNQALTIIILNNIKPKTHDQRLSSKKEQSLVENIFHIHEQKMKMRTWGALIRTAINFTLPYTDTTNWVSTWTYRYWLVKRISWCTHFRNSSIFISSRFVVSFYQNKSAETTSLQSVNMYVSCIFLIDKYFVFHSAANKTRLSSSLVQ